MGHVLQLTVRVIDIDEELRTYVGKLVNSRKVIDTKNSRW